MNVIAKRFRLLLILYYSNQKNGFTILAVVEMKKTLDIEIALPPKLI